MLRFAPLISLIALLIATLLRARSVRSNSGASAWAFAGATGRQRLSGIALAAAFAPIVLAATASALNPRAITWGVQFGAALAAAGATLAIAAQLHLGNAWRVGVRSEDAPLFIRTGLYRYNRNPIFLGMLIMVLGVSLASGAWWSWAASVLLTLATRTQIGIEERRLRSAFGKDYAQFSQQVPRWLFFADRRKDRQ